MGSISHSRQKGWLHGLAHHFSESDVLPPPTATYLSLLESHRQQTVLFSFSCEYQCFVLFLQGLSSHLFLLSHLNLSILECSIAMDSDSGVWVPQSTAGHMEGKLLLGRDSCQSVPHGAQYSSRHKECFCPNDNGADSDKLAP